MVEEQLRRRDISDPRVLEAMAKVPRQSFVPADYQPAAYEDRPLSIGEGQTISQPYMVAIMTQSLELKGKERVLEIGTGSGYQTAILAELSQVVFTVERIPTLIQKAQMILEVLGHRNIFFSPGTGRKDGRIRLRLKGSSLLPELPRFPRPFSPNWLKEAG